MLSAIVVAAGKSNRFSRHNKQWFRGKIPPVAGKGKVSKVLAKIDSKPAIYYSLFALNRHPGIDEIIVVASPSNIKAITGITRKYKINKVKKIVLGGKERRDSVLQGLKSLGEDTSHVLIHDGARPLVSSNIISSVIAAAKISGAAVAGVPVKPTIKRVSSGLWVKETVDRGGLWEIQTPQVFLKSIILKAYRKLGGLKVTDDAMLVERIKVKVKLAAGSYSNIKITTPEDLIIAGAILKEIKS
ncbi:MAG: 2-C-methyl-D-erythritol 4-phosphate cytidylyltransferase, partial [Candidatus Omnitrophota bacterium]